MKNINFEGQNMFHDSSVTYCTCKNLNPYRCQIDYFKAEDISNVMISDRTKRIALILMCPYSAISQVSPSLAIWRLIYLHWRGRRHDLSSFEFKFWMIWAWTRKMSWFHFYHRISITTTYHHEYNTPFMNH